MYDKKIIIELLKFIKENLNSKNPEKFTDELFFKNFENIYSYWLAVCSPSSK